MLVAGARAQAAAGAPADTARHAIAAPHDTLIIHRTADVIVVNDSLVGSAASLDSAGTDTTRRKAPEEFKGFEKPRWVMLRSVAVPGWGQWHNGARLKAGVIAGVEGVYVAKLFADHSKLNDLDANVHAARASGNAAAEEIAVAAYNDRSNKFIAHQWWLGAILAYSMLDAYIDANFRNFHVGVDDDPALPPEQRRAAGLKLSWQEHF